MMRSSVSMAVMLVMMSLVAGCRTVDTQVELSATQYTVTTMMLELPQESIEFLASASQSNVDTVVNRRDTKMTCFPTIHLIPDKTKEIDNRKSYVYPLEFGADGKPNRYENVKTGQLISTTLSLLKYGIPRLAISLYDSNIQKWKTFKSPIGEKYKYPVCFVRQLSTVVNPAWGQWETVGLAGEHIILVRLDQPTNSFSIGTGSPIIR